MTATLQARNITVTYRGASSPAVANVDLTVTERQAVGIVGESGSGKTTLGRVLVGALRPTGGDVRVNGRLWADVKRRDPERRSVQMIFQDPYGSLNPYLTPRDAVAEVIAVWEDVGRSGARDRADHILEECGLSRAAAGRLPRELSGGQCQRVGIARALAAHPAFLIADEPTSSLDVSVQAQILNLLMDLRSRRSLALVLISHDLAVVKHVTTETHVMYAGRVVEKGPTGAVFISPAHPYTRVLIDAIPGAPGSTRPIETVVRSDTGCAFAPRCPSASETCRTAPPQLIPTEQRAVACFHPLPTAALSAATAEPAADCGAAAPLPSKHGGRVSEDPD